MPIAGTHCPREFGRQTEGDMARKDLKNKPLTEAIFELKWEIPPQSPQLLQGDPNYRILFARFSEKVQDSYPVYELLPAAEVPDGLIDHDAQHRFRATENGWPLVQIGHGIVTVNDTDSYTWGDFRERARKAVDDLFESHPNKNGFGVKELTLRYLDAIEVDLENEDVFTFLQSKLKTRISLLDSLFLSGDVDSAPNHLVLETAFPSSKPSGTIFLKIGTGWRSGKPAVLLDTRVVSNGKNLPKMPTEFLDWLDSAHDLTDDWFFKLIEGELEERFSCDPS